MFHLLETGAELGEPTRAGDALGIGGISATVSHTVNGAGVETKFVDVFSFKLAAHGALPS